MPDTFRCSDAAREREDPLLGTAPPQPRLLLVEQDGGWGPEALASLAVPDEVREEVRRRAEAGRTRVMLIRRPGRQTSGVCLLRAWCVVDPQAPAGHRVTWGTWSYPTELLAAVERAEELDRWVQDAAEEPDGSSAPGDPVGPSTPAGASTPPGADEPLLLVCTNGRKDVCCAVRGRPVASALAQHWPEQTWECTHTGGDRFAANLLLLPDGVAYGGLDEGSAVETILAHREGHPATAAAHLRGQIGHPRPVQAALVGTLLELGLAWGQVQLGPRVVATHLLPEEQVRDRGEELAAQGSVVGRWRVDVDVDDGRQLVAEVTEHLRPAAPLTCKAVDAPARSRVPVLGRLEPRS